MECSAISRIVYTKKSRNKWTTLDLRHGRPSSIIRRALLEFDVLYIDQLVNFIALNFSTCALIARSTGKRSMLVAP